MKTVYTDETGVWPWAMLTVGVLWLWAAYEAFRGESWLKMAAFSVAGLVFLVNAAKRFSDVRKAKRAGEDPTIISVKND